MPKLSSPNARLIEATLEQGSDEIDDARLLTGLDVLPQLLVELDADEEHDRADEEVRRHEVDEQQAAEHAAVVRERGCVQPEEERLHGPADDDERRAAGG